MNFPLKNKKEVGLFFKISGALNKIREQRNIGTLNEIEGQKDTMTDLLQSARSFAYFLKDDECFDYLKKNQNNLLITPHRIDPSQETPKR